MLGMREIKALAAIILAVTTLTSVTAAAQHQGMGGHDPSHGMADFSDESRLNVAVLLYDGALVLDYGVAAEMFLAADYSRAFNVYTVSEAGRATVSILGETETNFRFEDAPDADIIIIPGGPLWTEAGKDADVVAYLESQHDRGATLFSICTGGMLLAQAGFLENRKATTLFSAHHMLRAISPSTEIVEASFVDGGDIVTAAGAGTAIEATLAVIKRVANPEISEDLRSRYLNYSLVDGGAE